MVRRAGNGQFQRLADDVGSPRLFRPLDQRVQVRLHRLQRGTAGHVAREQGIHADRDPHTECTEGFHRAAAGRWRRCARLDRGRRLVPEERKAYLQLGIEMPEDLRVPGDIQQHPGVLGEHAETGEQVPARRQPFQHEERVAMFAFEVGLQDVGGVRHTQVARRESKIPHGPLNTFLALAGGMPSAGKPRALPTAVPMSNPRYLPFRLGILSPWQFSRRSVTIGFRGPCSCRST